MERFINIRAESKILSVNETVPEKKAVKRLQEIRDSFKYLNERRKADDTLKVQTCLANPELF